MVDLLDRFLSSSPYMPHGHCYLWRPPLVALHVASDSLIGLAYLAISLTLLALVRRIRDLPFQWMYLAFGTFIVACGFTHFMEVWTVWTPLYWAAGLMKGITALASVITAVALLPLLPRAEALARSAEVAAERGRKLEAANRQLAALYERTRRLEQLKTSFFANVSHELRTPLALILGPLERLRERGLGAEERHQLDLMERSARLLRRHVDDLLEVSKLEAGRVELRYSLVDVGQLCRLTAAHYESLAEEMRVTLAVDAAGELLAQADAEKLERVLLNLLSNALKFTPPGGHVRCSARAAADEPERVVLEVADSGPGVPEDEVEAIFERFHQADRGDTRRFGGTGLGLAIARDLIELHGGGIAVSRAPEGGAAFTAWLPRRARAGAVVLEQTPARPPDAALQAIAELRPPRETPALQETPAAQEADPAAQLGATAPAEPRDAAALPLVVVVEDNAEMRGFIADCLAADFRVAAAATAQEGLAVARALGPDLVLSDMMMPGMSGEQLLRALRADAALSHTPFVFLTAKGDQDLRVRLLREGAQDYVMKPFVAAELRARIGALAEASRARELLRRELSSRQASLVELADELAGRRRELQTALDAARVAKEQAEGASAMKSQFLRLISHELRTPLTTIHLQVQRVKRDRSAPPSQRQLESLGVLQGAATRLQDMVESLLEHARIESGRLTLAPEPLSLQALAEELFEELRPLVAGRALALTLASGAALPVLHSDPRLVRLVLANLLGNAIKFTVSGQITVELSRHLDMHVIAVTDSGPGIPLDQQARIFEPFEQLEPVHRKHTPGVGLGLALVREMVAALGGRIELRSAPGEGSTFTVSLPNHNQSGQPDSVSTNLPTTAPN